MTDQEKTGIGYRAMVCKRFRWMAGMGVLCWYEGELSADRISRIQDGNVWLDSLTLGFPVDRLLDEEPIHFIDVTDPASVGCLLALVREAHNQPHVSTDYEDEVFGWWVAVGDVDDGLMFRGGSEAEALIVALEAAS